MTTEALRALINAILVFPGERRGKVSVTLRGIERRFLRSDAVVLQLAPANKKAALLGENGVGWEVLGTLGCGDAQPTIQVHRVSHLRGAWFLDEVGGERDPARVPGVVVGSVVGLRI
jgi:hypothetical protein